MSVEDGEDLRCDKEGYFDLESLKPYSSVWVSTRRDARSKTHQQDDDNDTKKNVMPSRACNNLHSLLETTEGCPSNGPSEEEIRMHVQQLSSTKSDHFPLNPYKLFEKSDSVSLRKISDRILESMCKSDSKVLFNDAESNYTCSPSKRLIFGSEVKSKERQSETVLQEQDCQEDYHKMDASEDEEVNDINCVAFKKYQKKIEDESLKEKVNREPSLSSHLAGGEPQEDLPNKCKLLSDNGKLVTEMNLTTLNLKDHAGREFPVTVKYIWETDINEIMNACDHAINSSSAFVKITESISSVGMKCDSCYLTNTAVSGGKMQTWQERSKSQSNCGQVNNRRLDCWNAEKETDTYHNVHGSKGDASSMRKGPFKDAQSMRNALLRTKVSIVGPYQDKKLFEQIHDHGKDTKMTEGNREGSKINMSERKALADRKNRIPVKKKFSAIGELRGPNTMARPATFNKREPAPRPTANRPPSAPTREMASRIPQRISIHESGDRLQAFNKRPFGSKFQAPTATTASNKFWK